MLAAAVKTAQTVRVIIAIIKTVRTVRVIIAKLAVTDVKIITAEVFFFISSLSVCSLRL